MFDLHLDGLTQAQRRRRHELENRMSMISHLHQVAQEIEFLVQEEQDELRSLGGNPDALMESHRNLRRLREVAMPPSQD